MKLPILILCCALALYAETPQQKADAQWLAQYHKATANLRKAQNASDELIKAKMADCEARGLQLLQDGWLEPTCQAKPIQAQPAKEPGK